MTDLDNLARAFLGVPRNDPDLVEAVERILLNQDRPATERLMFLLQLRGGGWSFRAAVGARVIAEAIAEERNR